MAQQAVDKMRSTHPTYLLMIKEAIAYLDEKKGSSRQKITKYLTMNYMVTPELIRVNLYVKKTLKKAVEEGEIVQTSGTGATGRFRLSKEAKENKKEGDKANEVTKKAPPKKKTVAESTGKVIKKKVVNRRMSAAKGAISAITPAKKQKQAVRKALSNAKEMKLNSTYDVNLDASSSDSSFESLFADIPAVKRASATNNQKPTSNSKPVAVVKANTLSEGEDNSKMGTTKRKPRPTTKPTTKVVSSTAKVRASQHPKVASTTPKGKAPKRQKQALKTKKSPKDNKKSQKTPKKAAKSQKKGKLREDTPTLA